MIWPPYSAELTDGTHNELTAMWYSVVRRNTRWRCIESDSSILIKDVCFIRVLLCLFISTRAPLCIAVAIYQSFAVLICFSLWSKHGGLYSRLILIKYWWCRWDWLMLLGWIGSLLLIGLNTVCPAPCPDWSQHCLSCTLSWLVSTLSVLHPVLIGLNTVCPAPCPDWSQHCLSCTLSWLVSTLSVLHPVLIGLNTACPITVWTEVVSCKSGNMNHALKTNMVDTTCRHNSLNTNTVLLQSKHRHCALTVSAQILSQQFHYSHFPII